jgi:hypothetical protein
MPRLAAEIAAAGHGVGVHGYRHRNQLRLSPGALERDLDRAAEVIGEATGSRCEVYRPPYGIFSFPGLALVRRRGLRPLLWSRWGRDWRASATAGSIAAKVGRGLSGGDVLLLHDADHYSAPGSWRATAAGCSTSWSCTGCAASRSERRSGARVLGGLLGLPPARTRRPLAGGQCHPEAARGHA